MKDYYYFLGVEKSATEEEIRRAYRKLSLKYHPDKNPGDPFFEERFREANEAYDTLSNPDARKVYDANSGTAEKSARNSLPPHIKNFSANKIRAKKGDEIIINWQTQNADLVKILPFGLEKNYGERSFRITEFTAGQFHIVLQATNTLINKSVVQGITITEVFENEADRIKNDVEKLFRPQQKAQLNPRGRSKFMLWVAALILFAAALIFLLKA